MTLDIFLLLVILTFTLVGYLTGILRQILKVSCVLLAFFMSGPTAKFINVYFDTGEHIGPITSFGLVRIGCWLVLYVLLRILAFYINQAVGADKAGVLRPINRRLGGYLGFLEGVGLSLVVLWALQVWINDEESMLFPTLRSKAALAYSNSWSQSSIAWQLASRWNPLIDWDFLPNIRTLIKVTRHPEVFDAVQQNPQVKKLLRHPKVAAVMRDASIRQALADRDYIAILRNPNFKAMMSDKEVRELTRNVRVFELLRTELDKLGERPPQRKDKPTTPQRKART